MNKTIIKLINYMKKKIERVNYTRYWDDVVTLMEKPC